MENVNPLKKYQRAPKLYVDLPSKGNWYPRNVLEKVEQLEVFSMTATDELKVKTPDALFTGQAVKGLIESCVPAIKDAWYIPTIDLDYLLAAIRIASYGDTMNVASTCPKCKESNDYALELQNMMDYLNTQDFEYELQVEGFTFRIRPFTYKELSEVQKETIILQRQIVQNMEKEDNEFLEDVYTKINNIASNSVCTMVTEVITPDGDSETNSEFIKDFLLNSEKIYFEKVRELQEKNVSNWKVPGFEAKCESCGEISEVQVSLDYSNFFVRR